MNEDAITRAIVPVLAGHDLELDRLEIVPAGHRFVVRITVDGDGPEGRGPLLDDIAEASRDLSGVLDDEPSLGSRPYTLEVSSRGVSAPLTEPKHFRRNAGRLVRIVRTDGSVVEDRIQGADEDGVELSGGRVALAEISKAVVQVELNRPADEQPASDEEEI